MQDKAKKYYKMYKDALVFHQSKFDEYQEAVAYYELEEKKIKSNANKPWIYQINTPFATDAINMRVASLQANDYTGALEPMSPEDIKPVEILDRLYHEKWKEMNMDSIIDDSILQSAIVGEAYAHIIFDSEVTKGGTGRKNKGELSCYFIDTASVHVDPKALSLKNADYVAISERITKQDLEREYEDFKTENLQGDSDPTAKGEIYTGDYTSEQDKDVYTKVTIYEKTKKGIEKTVIVEQVILEETTVLEVDYIPIAQMLWQKRLKSPYGTSLMAMLLPLQKVLNEIESANANANMQYSSPSFVISEDSGINPEEFAASAGAPAVVYTINSGVSVRDAVAPLLPDRGIDAGLVTTKQELERSIYKLAGITDQFLGSLGTAGNTSSGAEMTIQRAKTIEQRILTNIEEYVEDLTRIIVSYLSKAYAGEIVYAGGEKRADGKWQFDQVSVPENSAELDYNFSIELNIRTHYSKEAQKQQLLELWQMERQYATDDIRALNTLDVLKTLNIPQRNEIVDRFQEATTQDIEQKSMLVSEIVLMASELGLEAEAANAAVGDIIRGGVETPNLDMFLQQAEQMRAQIEQQDQTMQSAAIGAELDGMQEEMMPEVPMGG